MASPMVATGGVQVFSGFVLILVEIICMAMYYGGSALLYMPLIFGISYIITGALGLAGGMAKAGGARCLAIAALVMSIISILNSFALIIISAIVVVGYSHPSNYRVAALVGTQLAFFIIMFISSIATCVFAVRVMSSSGSRTSHVTQVTHVVGQPGVTYATGPQAYPAGQYAAPYPAGQQGQQYAAPYPQKV